MDGTLLDSAEYHLLSWQETFRGEGVDLSREWFLSTFGRRNDAVLPDLLGVGLADQTFDRLLPGGQGRSVLGQPPSGACHGPNQGARTARPA